jgi:hypothetical protein
LKDWRQAERARQYSDEQLVKIPVGIDFPLELTNIAYHWTGDGSGEKGYAWMKIPEETQNI